MIASTFWYNTLTSYPKLIGSGVSFISQFRTSAISLLVLLKLVCTYFNNNRSAGSVAEMDRQTERRAERLLISKYTFIYEIIFLYR